MDLIEFIPAHLHDWVKTLTKSDIANILTIVGGTLSIKQDVKPEVKQEVSSAIIGLAGEEEVMNIIRERYTLLNTTKSGKCGDFIILINGISILIEVKKYGKTVPSIEVDKFIRDIDANSSISGAIMISLSSAIVGRRSMEYSLEYVRGVEFPVIYLSLKDSALRKDCIFYAIDILLTSINSMIKHIDIHNNIDNVINNIDKNIDFLSQCRLTIHDTQSIMNKQMGKLLQQVLSAEINIKNSINDLKKSINTEIMIETPIKDILNEMKSVEISQYNMLVILLEGRKLAVSKNIIQTTDKKITVKIAKTIKITIAVELKSVDIEGDWSYSGKALTVVLTEHTLGYIMKLL